MCGMENTKKFGYRQPKSTGTKYDVGKKISKSLTKYNTHPFRKGGK